MLQGTNTLEEHVYTMNVIRARLPVFKRELVLLCSRKDVPNEQGHRCGTLVTHPSPSNVCAMRQMPGLKLWTESSRKHLVFLPTFPPETHPWQRSTTWGNKNKNTSPCPRDPVARSRPGTLFLVSQIPVDNFKLEDFPDLSNSRISVCDIQY